VKEDLMSNISTAAEVLELETKTLSQETSSDYLSIATRVLQTEAEAIAKLAATLDNNFNKAINILFETKGKVVVRGVGKSGHIARKIAATMASTGTPSFFVHPNEASHGDMGMIRPNDSVIAISNSGEAKELNDIVAYCKRFAIPLISITSRKDSMLDKNADVTLLLPEHKEACPNNLAPTTSTTLTMALGDALAITLLEKRGFTPKDYKVFHPGGKLGQQLIKVSELMHKGDELPIASEDTSIKEALDVMTAKNFGTLAITDASNKLVGILTDGDIRRKLGAISSAKTIKEVMSKNPKTIHPDTLVGEAMGIMNDVKGNSKKITCVLVADDDNEMVGLLHIHDCLKAGFS